MFRYVIIPIRRSTAEAIHLMATHALGEAGAPYIIGIISDVSTKYKYILEVDIGVPLVSVLTCQLDRANACIWFPKMWILTDQPFMIIIIIIRHLYEIFY